METIILAVIGLIVALGGEWIRRVDKNRTDRLIQLEKQYDELKTEAENQEGRLMAKIDELESKVVYWMDRYYGLLEESIKKQTQIQEAQTSIVEVQTAIVAEQVEQHRG